MQRNKIGEESIVHGSSGYPDWMLITTAGQLLGYEIKPEGSSASSRLNGLQRKTAEILLKSKACRLFLVHYTATDGTLSYGPEIELTLANLNGYS